MLLKKNRRSPLDTHKAPSRRFVKRSGRADLVVVAATCPRRPPQGAEGCRLLRTVLTEDACLAYVHEVSAPGDSLRPATRGRGEAGGNPSAPASRAGQKRRGRVLRSSGAEARPAGLTRSVTRIVCSVINWSASLPCLTATLGSGTFQTPQAVSTRGWARSSKWHSRD